MRVLHCNSYLIGEESKRGTGQISGVHHAFVLLFITRKNGDRRSSFSQTQGDTTADAAGYDSDASTQIKQFCR